MSLVSDVQKITAPLRRKVDLMVARSVLRLTKFESGIQFAQLDLLADETRDNVENIQQYGFASTPEDGSVGVVVCVAGDRAHAVLIATDDPRHRPDLEVGEVAIYTKFGDQIRITKDGEILIDASAKVIITTPEVEMSGNLSVDGDITAMGDITDGTRSMAGDRTIYNGHKHGGVTTGPGTSAVTDSPM